MNELIALDVDFHPGGPESLFCDTDFLRKIIRKDPAKGDECRDTEKK